MRPSASIAARTSRPARKIRTPPPKRSPPPANSSIRKPGATTPSRRKKRRPTSNAGSRSPTEPAQARPIRPGLCFAQCRRIAPESIARSAARAVRRAQPAAGGGAEAVTAGGGAAGGAAAEPQPAVAGDAAGAGVPLAPDASRLGGRRRRGCDGGNRIGPQRRGLAAAGVLRRVRPWRYQTSARSWPASDLAASDLAGLGLAASGLLARSLAGLAPWRFGLASSSWRASPLRLGAPRPASPRLLSLCLAVSLRPSGPRSAAAWAAAWPAGGGLCRVRRLSGRASRLASPASRPAGAMPSASGLAACCGSGLAASPAPAACVRAAGLGFRRLRLLGPAWSGRRRSAVSVAPLEIRIGAEQRGHLAAGGVMLAQEARQRSRRTVLNRPRGLLWQAVQVPAKIWEGLLPASRFVACACAGSAAKQPIRSITVAKLSARLNIPILQMRKSLPASRTPTPVAAVTF